MTSETRRRDVLLITLLGLGHSISHFFQLVIPPLFPWIMPEFGVNYTQMGAVMTLFFITSTAGQAASGIISDKWGAKKTLFSGISLLLIASIILAIAPNYYVLFLVTFLAGMGNSVFHPTDYSLMNRLVSADRLPFAFSIHLIMGNVGWIIAPILMVGVASIFGWRAAAVAAGGVVACVLLMFVFARHLFDLDPAAHDLGSQKNRSMTKEPEESKAGSFAFLLAPAVWLCFGFFFFNSFALSILQNFSPSIFGEVYQVPHETATMGLTSYMVGNAVGVVVGAWLAKLFTDSERVVASCLSVSFLMACVLATGIIPTWSIFIVMAVLGLGCGLANPSRDMMIRSTCMQKVGKNSFGRVYGFTYCGMDFGQTLAPLAAGALLDLGYYMAALALVAAMQLCAIFTTIGVRKQR